MSNLRLINETTVSSSVANVSVTDVFSENFDIYKININNIDLTTSGSNAQIIFRCINSSGSPYKATEYDFAYQNIKVSGTFTDAYNQNQSGIDGIVWLGEDTADSSGSTINVFNPFSSDKFTKTSHQSFSMLTTNNGYGTKGFGWLKNIYSMAGFQLLISTGTINTMNIRTYGLRVDS